MKQHNQVLSKFGRAGLVALFATGLAFTGVAPASALEGQPTTPGDVANAVARIELPKVAEVEVEKGKKETFNFMDTCSGVLISPTTVLTVRKCLPNNLSPYDIISKRGDTPASPIDQILQTFDKSKVAPVKVTFGTSVMPKGADKTYDPKQVFMGTEVYKDLGVTPLALLELDRAVPENVAKPIAPKDLGENGYPQNTTGTVYGWADATGEPKMLGKHATLDTPYLVNGTGSMPQKINKLWELFSKAPQDFSGTETGSDAGMGQVSNEKVRKGFGMSEVRFHGNDDGAPFFSDAGELVAMHIGSGVLLDLGQSRVQPFLSHKMTPYDTKWATKVLKIEPADMAARLKELQNYVCNTRDEDPKKDESNLLQGYKFDRKDDGKLKVLQDDFTVKTDDDTSLKSESLPGETNKSIESVSLAACKDQSNVTPASLRATLEWGKSVFETILKLEKEINDEKQLLDQQKQTVAANKLKFDEAATFLQSYADGGFSPDVYTKQINDLGAEQAYNALPQRIREGVKVTPQKTERDGVDIKTSDLATVQLLPPITKNMKGSDIVTELKKALALAKVNSELTEQEATGIESRLKDVTEKSNRMGTSKQYAENVLESINQIEQLVGKAGTGIVPVVQDNWKKAYDEKNKLFVSDYKQWRDKMNNAADAAVAANNALSDANTAIKNKGAKPAGCDTKPTLDQCKQWESDMSALQKAKEAKQQERTAKLNAYQEVLKTKPNPADAKYKVVQDAAALANALNEMPLLMSVAQHYGFVLQDIRDNFKGRPYKFQPEIESNANQIKSLLDESINKNDEIRYISRDINKLYGDLEKKIVGAPEKIKGDLEYFKKSILQNSQTMTDVGLAGQQAVKKLEKLYKDAQHSPSTDKSREYLVEAGKSRKQIQRAWETAQKAMKEAQEAMSKAEERIRYPDGNPQGDDPTKGMTPEQKEKYLKEKAEKEKKEKEEAEKRRQQGGGQGGTGSGGAQSPEDKAKAEADQKKDEARLAKALSKNTLRAEGTDRVLTAIAAWKIGKFPGDSLVLVDGNVHADGLSATPFASALKAPVLLTKWKTGLEPALMDQIKASGKKKLFLVGGQVPMTPYDEFELRDAGLDIFRIAGPDRYATSVAVNQATEPLIGAKPKKPINLYIGDGVGFPDALVAGAAAGRVGGLMLLSKGQQLDPQTYNYISNLGQTRPLKIIPVGGPAAKAVKNTPWPTTMSINVTPIVGKDRYETAAKLATTLPGTKAAVLATGENFADALAGGPLAVDQNATLVLTRTQELPPASYQSLQRFGTEKTIVMGGKSAVSPKVAELINGATLKNTDTKTVLGTLLERKKLRDEKADREAKERRNALSKVKEMIKDGNSLKDIMSQLGIGSIDDLTKLLNESKTQQDKDKKPDSDKKPGTEKPKPDKGSTTTGK